MNINPDEFKHGVFIWEDFEEHLHVGISQNIEDDPVFVISLLTDAINSLTIDFLKPTSH